MVTYQFYNDTYHGGSISPEDWPAAEREARATLERYRRSYTVTAPGEHSEDMAICAMAEVLVQASQASALSSASVGSVSVSYRAPDPKQQKRDLFEAATMYLDIYRGVC